MRLPNPERSSTTAGGGTCGIICLNAGPRTWSPALKHVLEERLKFARLLDMESKVPEHSIEIITPGTEPGYRELISNVAEEIWPEFMLHDPIANQHWDGLFNNFPSYQFAILDAETRQVVGIANSVPLHWGGSLDQLPDQGWDWAIIKSHQDHARGVTPNLHCAIQIAIKPGFQGQGLSRTFLNRMRELTRGKGFSRLIAPVRPSRKSLYPLTPIDRYVDWTTPEGLPFDPWLRVHIRAGGRIIKPCPSAMRISAPIEDWERWTDMRFPESGRYVVPGALAPPKVDRIRNEVTFVEAGGGDYRRVQSPQRPSART